MTTPDRASILAEAVQLVGRAGEVQDYQCDCPPGGERFLVSWWGYEHRRCYNIEELRRQQGAPPVNT